jgi:hypothetical protein
MSDQIAKALLHLEAAVKLLKQKKTALKGFDPTSKKAWFNMIKLIDDPHYCESLIIQLEARKQQLNPDFISKTVTR